MDYAISVVKTKALISFTVTAKLICAFVSHMQKAGFLTTRLIWDVVAILSYDLDHLLKLLPPSH